MQRGLMAGGDEGYFYINLQLPKAASLQRTDEVCRKIENLLSRTPGVAYVTTTIGSSLLSGVQSTYGAFLFVSLAPWKEREQRNEHYQGIKPEINRKLPQFPEPITSPFPPPPLP